MISIERQVLVFILSGCLRLVLLQPILTLNVPTNHPCSRWELCVCYYVSGQICAVNCSIGMASTSVDPDHMAPSGAG